LLTSPAAPSTIADVESVKNFGSIVATGSESSGSSPAAAKVTAPAQTDSPTPTLRKKVDIASLFQKPQHMPSPITPLSGGQMPHQIGMPPQMWGYYVSLFLIEYSLTDRIPSTNHTTTLICLLKDITGQVILAISALTWWDDLIFPHRNSKRLLLCHSLIWLRPLNLRWRCQCPQEFLHLAPILHHKHRRRH
jgi:hypothetical protein